MTIIKNIQELRKLTSLPLSDCKIALEKSDNDVQKAVEYLQKQGYKHNDNVVCGIAGKIATALGGKGLIKWASILEMNCQTDFSANSELMDRAIQSHLGTKFDEFEMPWVDETLSKQLKEHCVLTRGVRVLAEEGQFCETYDHHNGNIGVIVVMNGCNEQECSINPEIQKFAQEICLQIAATNPKYFSVLEIPTDVIAKQKEIFEGQLALDPKPKTQQSWPKIIEGKLQKWYSEVVLLKQESVIYPKKSIEVLLQELSNKVDIQVKIVNFVRYELGENK